MRHDQYNGQKKKDRRTNNDLQNTTHIRRKLCNGFYSAKLRGSGHIEEP
jgi:hypothetical protein